MQLKDYLRLEREGAKDFAARVEVTIHAIRKWIRGERMPRPKTIMRIQEATKGAVTANDWLIKATEPPSARPPRRKARVKAEV